jgi:hypothetical protein
MSRKTSPSTGGRKIFLDIQPTVYVSAPMPLKGFALGGFSFVWFSLPVTTTPIGWERLRKRA